MGTEFFSCDEIYSFGNYKYAIQYNKLQSLCCTSHPQGLGNNWNFVTSDSLSPFPTHPHPLPYLTPASGNHQSIRCIYVLGLFIFLLIWGREEGEEGRRERGRRERESLICCSTYLCIHWLLLICVCARDPTPNLGVSGQHSNHLSYPAWAGMFLFCF